MSILLPTIGASETIDSHYKYENKHVISWNEAKIVIYFKKNKNILKVTKFTHLFNGELLAPGGE